MRIANPGPPALKPGLAVEPIVDGLGGIARDRLDRAGGVKGSEPFDVLDRQTHRDFHRLSHIASLIRPYRGGCHGGCVTAVPVLTVRLLPEPRSRTTAKANPSLLAFIRAEHSSIEAWSFQRSRRTITPESKPRDQP